MSRGGDGGLLACHGRARPFATTANAGHFRPLVPFAEACLRAGHDVVVAGQAGAAPAARRAGLSFRALAEPDHEQLAIFRAGQEGLSATQAMARALTKLYIGLYASAALEDTLAVIEEWRPDVVVRESAEFSSLVAAQRLGVPHARVGIGLSTQLESQMLALAGPALDQLGATVGVGSGLAARAARSLCLTMAPASLDGPGSSETERVRRFHQAPAGLAGSPPDGWGDPAAPLVYLSFGTEVPSPERNYFPGLYHAAIDALQGTGARLLVTIGDQRDPAELGRLPEAVRVERWVSQAELMPHTAVMVGHAGAGSTLSALAAGVPMALVPLFADQPFNARLVAELGAAIALDDGPASLPKLEQAALELLSDARYGDQARAIADEIQTLPPIEQAPNSLSALAEDRAPVGLPHGVGSVRRS
jgi:UDP:flavonoid glycosyltransferase YjiC (YdhE family)